MRARFHPRWILLALLLSAASGAAQAGVGRLADVEIYDRSSGRVLPVYWRDGRHYVAGQPGHEYEIRLRSRRPERVLAVTSVDGVNVVSGQTAATGQGGYVLDGYGGQAIAGWRKSLSQTAAFYFTALPDSYAARTGRPGDVGVIGLALFREAQPYLKQPQARIAEPRRRARSGSERESAPSADDRAAGSVRSEAHAPPPAAMPEEKLGTGHGRREWSSARYTQFQRASSQPDEVIEIWYDSEANLIAQGVIPAPYWPPRPDRPRAFPAGFVPDP